MDFLIKNCKAEDFAYACPKLWSELKPAFSSNVRHCEHCDRKVYLCRTDADLNFYSSVNFCIAIADLDSEANQIKQDREGSSKDTAVGDRPDTKVRFMGISVQAARQAARQMNTDDIPTFLKKTSLDNSERE